MISLYLLIITRKMLKRKSRMMGLPERERKYDPMLKQARLFYFYPGLREDVKGYEE